MIYVLRNQCPLGMLRCPFAAGGMSQVVDNRGGLQHLRHHSRPPQPPTAPPFARGGGTTAYFANAIQGRCPIETSAPQVARVGWLGPDAKHGVRGQAVRSTLQGGGRTCPRRKTHAARSCTMHGNHVIHDDGVFGHRLTFVRTGTDQSVAVGKDGPPPTPGHRRLLCLPTRPSFQPHGCR